MWVWRKQSLTYKHKKVEDLEVTVSEIRGYNSEMSAHLIEPLLWIFALACPLSARNFYGLFKLLFSLFKPSLRPISPLMISRFTNHTTQEQQDNSFHCKHKYKTRQLLCLNKPSPILPILEVSFYRKGIHNRVPRLEKLPYILWIIRQRLLLRLDQRLDHRI